MSEPSTEPVAPPDASSNERWLSRPLLAFLLLVGGVLVYSAVLRFAAVDLETAIRELADGDLEGPYPSRPDEPKGSRVRMLEVARDLGAEAPAADARAQWAGLLAAVALADRPAFEAAVARLGGGAVPSNVPVGEARRFLDLGDPVLGNLAAAYWAEAAGDREAARLRWQQVTAQCRYAPRPLAAALAAEALERLR